MAYRRKMRSRRSSKRGGRRYKKSPTSSRTVNRDRLGMSRYIKEINGDGYTQTFTATGLYGDIVSRAGANVSFFGGALELQTLMSKSTGYQNVESRFNWVKLNWMVLEVCMFNGSPAANSNAIVAYIPKTQFEALPTNDAITFNLFETPGSQIRLVTLQKPQAKFRIQFVQMMESYRNSALTGYVGARTKDVYISTTNNVLSAPAASGGWFIIYAPTALNNDTAFTYKLSFSVTFVDSTNPT